MPDSLEESNDNVKDVSVTEQEQVEEECGDLQDHLEAPLDAPFVAPLDAEADKDDETNTKTDFSNLEKQEVEDSDGDVDLPRKKILIWALMIETTRIQ